MQITRETRNIKKYLKQLHPSELNTIGLVIQIGVEQSGSVSFSAATI